MITTVERAHPGCCRTCGCATTCLADDRTITFQHPIDDPFVHHTVHLGWRDLLRGLLRRHLAVTTLVGGDREIVNDVMELDGNTLTPNSTRRREFNGQIHKAIERHAYDEEFKEITEETP